MMVNLHAFLDASTENGPGTRAVIWVQGCTLACPGCFNPDTHDLAIRQAISTHDLAAHLLALSNIEGITISGGEPFLQAAPLAELCAIMRQHDRGVIVFSGFPFETLVQAERSDWNALLAVTDLLIAGPFVLAEACDLALRGSRNQTLHFLSGRYAAYREQFDHEANSVEIMIDETGQVTMTGFPSMLITPENLVLKM